MGSLTLLRIQIPCLPQLVAVPDQPVLLDDTPALDALVAPADENAENVELPVVPEYEYQDFITLVLRNLRSAVDRSDPEIE